MDKTDDIETGWVAIDEQLETHLVTHESSTMPRKVKLLSRPQRSSTVIKHQVRRIQILHAVVVVMLMLSVLILCTRHVYRLRTSIDPQHNGASSTAIMLASTDLELVARPPLLEHCQYVSTRRYRGQLSSNSHLL